MLVVADNDVGGAVAMLRRILESADNAAWLEILLERIESLRGTGRLFLS
jgi:hypothetical protein